MSFLIISEKNVDQRDTSNNKSSPVEQSLQSFIETNLSNNTRRISSQKPSIIRRRSSVKSTNQDLSDKTNRNDKSAKNAQSLEGI